ncbi:MAG: NRDE family protein, partial [Actinomycetia bacterium]|nr:NRDE family protein [Actinomycetes bacterium]
DPPLLLTSEPPRWGGRDRVAGGTWLAVDPGGRIGAVTNRHPGGVLATFDASRRTRGTLPLDALAGSDADALAWMESLRPSDFNPVNVLYASSGAALWTALDDERGRKTARLTPGIHVLAEQELDGPADPKAARILGQAQAALQAAAGPDDLVLRLRDVLGSHETSDAGSAACIHTERHGTVSSATVIVTNDGVRYEHAEGPACGTEFKRVI